MPFWLSRCRYNRIEKPITFVEVSRRVMAYYQAKACDQWKRQLFGGIHLIHGGFTINTHGKSKSSMNGLGARRQSLS
jgi:hypothetical protein